MNSYLSAGVSPVLARRLPPDRPPHFLDYFVPPCRLLLLRIFLFYAPSSRLFFARRRGVHRSCRTQLDTCEVFLLAKLCVGVFSPSLVAPFSSSLCRPPAFWAALSPCLLPALAHSDSQLLLSENQEAACPTYTQSRIGSGRAGEETAGVGRAQGEGEKGQERGPALAR